MQKVPWPYILFIKLDERKMTHVATILYLFLVLKSSKISIGFCN